MHRFEDLAQQLIEASLSRLLREQLQAGMVLRALVRAIEDAQATVRGADVAAPNHFWVTLNAADLTKLAGAHPMLAEDLAEQTRQVMLQLGFRLDAAPRVLLQGLHDIAPHTLRVSARWLPVEAPRTTTASQPGSGQAPAPEPLPRRPFLIVDGRRQVDLNTPYITVGRSRESDVVLDDRRVSRKHLELRWVAQSERFLAIDVGSSGGTRVNGHAVKQVTLEAGDVLSLGGCELIYGEEFSLSSTSPVQGTTSES
jgi:hypothetical protein